MIVHYFANLRNLSHLGLLGYPSVQKSLDLYRVVSMRPRKQKLWWEIVIFDCQVVLMGKVVKVESVQV